MSNFPDDIHLHNYDPRSPFCDEAEVYCPVCQGTMTEATDGYLLCDDEDCHGEIDLTEEI